MSLIAYLNITLAVVCLVLMITAIRRMPEKRCGDTMISDALILVAYLLMVNSHYMAQQSPYADVAAQAWHLFDTAVILNIWFHAKAMSDRRAT